MNGICVKPFNNTHSERTFYVFSKKIKLPSTDKPLKTVEKNKIFQILVFIMFLFDFDISY